MMRFAAVASCGLVVSVAGHGAMTFPKPRNSVDGTLAPWTKWGSPTVSATSSAFSLLRPAATCIHTRNEERNDAFKQLLRSPPWFSQLG